MNDLRKLLRVGDIVKVRNGEFFLVTSLRFITYDGFMSRSSYNADLINIRTSIWSESYDIMDVYQIKYSAFESEIIRSYNEHKIEINQSHHNWFYSLEKKIQNHHAIVRCIYSRDNSYMQEECNPNIF